MCGGFVGDVLGGIGDAIGGVVDGVSNIVSDIGSGIDDMVHDIIPGGWAGIGAGALLAMGIVDPGLLGLASEGALTSEAVAAAGLDAAEVASTAAAVAPEVAAATEAAAAAGLSPEIIAMANATTDPIAALNAAAGWTTADTAYLTSIGATPALIDAAEAHNAIIANGGTPGVTNAARMPGSNTQVFDDGSTLTTHPDGTVSATDINGKPTQTLVSPGGPGQAPVYDATGTAVPGTNNPLGNADPTLLQGMKDLGSAGLEALGLGNMSAGQIAALMAAGALAPSVLNALGFTGGKNVTGGKNYEPLPIPKIPTPETNLAQGGLNPGWITAQPFYNTTNDVQAKYYWGEHPYMSKAEDLANYNKVPGAPAEPWGIHEGPAKFDVNQFIQNTINPQWQAASAGSSPGLYRPQPNYGPTPQVTAKAVQPQYVTPAGQEQLAPVNPADVINASMAIPG